MSTKIALFGLKLQSAKQMTRLKNIALCPVVGARIAVIILPKIRRKWKRLEQLPKET
jgi:hypothetical protein